MIRARLKNRTHEENPSAFSRAENETCRFLATAGPFSSLAELSLRRTLAGGGAAQAAGGAGC